MKHNNYRKDQLNVAVVFDLATIIYSVFMYSQTLQQNKSVNQHMQGLVYQQGLEVSSTRSLGFYLYMIFLVSFLLHMPTRIQILGDIRFDLLLMIAISLFIILGKAPEGGESDNISKYLYLLFVYIIISTPFVKWPGSVIKNNLFEYIKAVVFFFFTANLIRTKKDLKLFMIVFIFCQTFRVLEPVWLHIREGYWGDSAYIGGGEFQNRLCGAPGDPVNPNGLAWIIVSTFPFMFFLTRHRSFIIKLLTYAILGVFIYALQLTESRSGLIGLAVVMGGIIWKSKHKIILIALAFLAAAIIFARLDPLTQDRYLSIYRDDVKGSQTAIGRIKSWGIEFQNVLTKPIVGHGLGTSLEANVNISGRCIVSHNLYLEVLLELGVIGFVIFMLYIKSIIRSFFIVKKRVLLKSHNTEAFLIEMIDALQVWVALALIFSMASYGLNKPIWYFFGGLSVVLLRLSETRKSERVCDILLERKNIV